MVSVPSLGRVHLVPVGLAAVVVAILVGAIALGASVAPVELAGMALATLAILPKAFERTREDPRTPMTTSFLLTVSFALLYASPPRSLFEGGLAALMAVGTVVEAYNYRTGSTLLRLDA
ncbi:phosphatidate cytidylyltransferase [Halorubellus sp. JP-L1]|uniref:phosphatidate cytidylyltransferase n=1 Tax=Halorubellus sp. JP-L1 TaxID=2715753 RepID=UPI00140C0D8E|nr:phosphatidate cytidylyltransferase [Halorubellus sp. JP-L1]NHN41105.1 phosphatidate cytidylyltransferase [Halorubellus sp. JP-L1]